MLSTIIVAEIPTATSLDVGTINYKWINNLSLMSIDHELSSLDSARLVKIKLEELCLLLKKSIPITF